MHVCAFVCVYALRAYVCMYMCVCVYKYVCMYSFGCQKVNCRLYYMVGLERGRRGPYLSNGCYLCAVSSFVFMF